VKVKEVNGVFPTMMEEILKLISIKNLSKVCKIWVMSTSPLYFTEEIKITNQNSRSFWMIFNTNQRIIQSPRCREDSQFKDHKCRITVRLNTSSL